MGDFIINVFRSILFFFDQIIYGFIPTLYNFIDLLARQSIFSDADLQKFANNIYAVLGVFMLFRLAFVLLNAIIDPDKLTDKNKGAAKMVSRAIVALVLIVAIPWAFTFAFRLQKVIMDKNLIAKIIIGTDGSTGGSPGQQMGKVALSSFLTCSDAIKTCDQDALDAGFNAAFPSADAEDQNANFQKLSDLLNNKGEAKDQDSGDVYMYNYSAVISTICGGFILFMLVTFSFDIAVRVVKLGFLQLITPVAVIGYIEPDGGIFNRWLKMCFSTYINLFVRILAITFVIYILSLLDNANLFIDAQGNAVSGVTLAFVKIFIIIGALMFAKQAPDMLKSLFKLDEASLGTLNPMKKLASVPVIGGAAAGGVALGATAAANRFAAGAGALGGGIGSKLKGGTFAAGAKAGAAAGSKSIPIKKGVKASDALKGMAGAGFAGGAAGYGSDAARLAAMEKQIKGPSGTGNDPSAIFRSQSVRDSFNDYNAAKSDLKSKKGSLSGAQSRHAGAQTGFSTASSAMANANNRYTRASQMLSSAKGSHDAAVSRADELKKKMDAALAAGGSLDRGYIMAKQDYNDYTSSASYTDSVSRYSSAQTEFNNAQSEFSSVQSAYNTAKTEFETSQSDLQRLSSEVETAESTFSTLEGKFNQQMEDPANKKDADAYKLYQTGKKQGRF